MDFACDPPRGASCGGGRSGLTLGPLNERPAVDAELVDRKGKRETKLQRHLGADRVGHKVRNLHGPAPERAVCEVVATGRKETFAVSTLVRAPGLR